MTSILVCGVINWDTTLFVDKLPIPGEEVRVNRISSVPGGKGANTAVAAARILGASEVGIIGMLGVDEIANKQIKILENEGIDVSLIMKHERLESGHAYVVVDSNGEDMILTHMAANQMMTPEIIVNEGIRSGIKQASMIIIIDPPLEVASKLAEQAKQMGKIVVLSPALLSKYGLIALRNYFNNADYIILNEQEASFLASAKDGISACKKISEILDGKNNIITTLGNKGCVLCHNGKIATIPTIDMASFGLKIQSTAGAGDTFIGTFGAFKTKGFNDAESLFLANIAAALKTTKEETRGSPSYTEIKRYADDERMRLLFNNIEPI